MVDISAEGLAEPPTARQFETVGTWKYCQGSYISILEVSQLYTDNREGNGRAHGTALWYQCSGEMERSEPRSSRETSGMAVFHQLPTSFPNRSKEKGAGTESERDTASTGDVQNTVWKQTRYGNQNEDSTNLDCILF